MNKFVKLYMHLLLECYSSLKGMFNAPRQTFQLNIYYYCYYGHHYKHEYYIKDMVPVVTQDNLEQQVSL